MINKIVFGLILVILLANCKKTHDQIPNVGVNFYVYLNEPSYAPLNTVGNYIYVNGGNKGIIIYRKTLDDFAAYERTCPYDPFENGAIVEVDSSGIELIDRHCGSKFNILDGSVRNGPATSSLRQYAADWDGANILHVHN